MALNLLDDIDLETDSRDHAIKLKIYYQSCMNTTVIDQLDSKPLTDLLTELIADVWPLSTKTNSNESDWTQLYLNLKTKGLTNDMLFSLSVITDIRNNSRRVLSLDQPSLGLNRDYLLKPENDFIFNSYRKLMTRSALKLSYNQKDINETIIDSIIKLETTLANISMPKDQRKNITLIIYETDYTLNDVSSLDDPITIEEQDYLRAVYSRKTIKQLIKISPNINWLRIIRTSISEDVSETDEIIINDISFIKKLDKLILKTDNKLIVNYMIWRIIQSKQLSLSNDWLRIRRDFDSLIQGIKKGKPRCYQCIKTVESSLQILVSHLYVKHFFSPDIKQKATELIESVRSEFKNTLNRADWVDEQTLTSALDKLTKMRIMVGYPDQILNETLIKEYYEPLLFNSSDFFGNILKVNEWKQNYSLYSLKKPNNIHDWRRVGSLTRANAYYSTVKNMVSIPAAILQQVFYNKDRPNYLNYGAIAKTAAHEIIHGFDSHGRHFDAEGNFNYWWNGVTDQKYREKAKCFVNQYNDYFIESLGLNVNGIQTKAENIADNGGIKLAFRAYHNFVDSYGQEQMLPALNYTSDQLFWIMYGVHYCSKKNSESLKNLILNDSHTPKKFRINGALSNSEDFSKSFNCPMGSPMNPLNKCSIW